MIELDVERMKEGTASAVRHLAGVLLISERDAFRVFDAVQHVVISQNKPPVFDAEKAKTGWIGATVALREVLPHLTMKEAKTATAAIIKGGNTQLIRILEHAQEERNRIARTLKEYDDIMEALNADYPYVVREIMEKILEERENDDV